MHISSELVPKATTTLGTVPCLTRGHEELHVRSAWFGFCFLFFGSALRHEETFPADAGKDVVSQHVIEDGVFRNEKCERSSRFFYSQKDLCYIMCHIFRLSHRPDVHSVCLPFITAIYVTT